ncbi:rhamnulokinase [Modestobacter sp. VKM Ac-2978]|uniref:rhamnulokinase n=1 Tax=Modestobacter sp. VKM Ac-2978 TaxID=3004132 RepID=UPI0022AAED6D|nr:rhamnulokinase family protein [Modestobacter sp. VKM Ac-2978]MCZ2847838.1 rhamnulokinase [Modestobacter sp. VKM Ac-2978]
MSGRPGTGQTVAAVDLGAESGRVVAATFDGQRLDLDVVGRFPNGARPVDGVLRWEFERLWGHVEDQLAALGQDRSIASVGVDTWGVDYGLLRADGTLLDEPTCYRDPRQVRAMAEAIGMVGQEALYAATGCQTMEINGVFALLDDAHHTDRLAGAATLLMVPDLFHHRLSGLRATEHTAASTSGMYDTATGRWATGLLDALQVPTHLLPAVVAPGTDVGPVVGPLAEGPLAGTRVVVPTGHDTAAAVVGTPFSGPGGLFISSGTWSLMGVERDDALVTPETSAANLTNEGGYAGTVRLLRNVMGLWILQECRRQWAREGADLSYTDLVELATAEPPLRSIVNPNATDFLAPGDMPSRLRAYCARHGDPVPETVGAVVRCVIDSLALTYRATAEDLVAVTGQPATSINVTGGGSQNALLAQATADATGLPVHCGPVEATALGNAGVQLIALGELADLADLRRVVAASGRLRTYEPRSSSAWDDAAARLRQLMTADDQARGLRGG